jgi:phenylacetic acid degradation operon negative regulatory protein
MTATPASPDDGSALPKPSARSILLTLVGEMMYDDQDATVWTGALLRVLGMLGVEEYAARQLLTRSASDGWLERERIGRAARWRLAPHGRELIAEGRQRSRAYLDGDSAWEGEWLILYVSVPQRQRTTRSRLYGGLAWLGMGSPMPGVWVTPHTERRGELQTLVASLGLGTSSMAVVGSLQEIGLSDREIVERSWDLSGLAVRYRAFIDQYEHAGLSDSQDQLLVDFIRLFNGQQRFMRYDPQLPPQLLPDWIGRDAATLLRQRRESWRATAYGRFWEIVNETSPA